jgi:hypothetical protein
MGSSGIVLIRKVYPHCYSQITDYVQREYRNLVISTRVGGALPTGLQLSPQLSGPENNFQEASTFCHRHFLRLL